MINRILNEEKINQSHSQSLHAGLNFTAKQIKKFWYLKKLCNQNTTERDFVYYDEKISSLCVRWGPPT